MGKKAARKSLRTTSALTLTPNTDDSGGQNTFAALFTSPTVPILVGSRRITYHLHKDVLIAKCPYFRSRFHYQEQVHSEDKTIYCIEDVDHEDAFEAFIQFIYFAKYDSPSVAQHSLACMLHARVYVLAERLCMEELKELSYANMSLLLQGTTSGFGTRGLFVYPMPVNADVLVELLQVVYDGTRDNDRWFDSADLAVAGDTQAEVEPIQGQDQGEMSICSAPEHEVEQQVVPEDKYGSEHERAAESELQASPSLPAIHTTDGQYDHPDKMRLLLSKYAAGQLRTLRENANFMALASQGGAIMTDIIESC